MHYKTFIAALFFIFTAIICQSLGERTYAIGACVVGGLLLAFVAGYALAYGKPIRCGVERAYELCPGFIPAVGIHSDLSLVFLNPTSMLNIHEYSEFRDRGREQWQAHLVSGRIPQTRFVHLEVENGSAILTPLQHLPAGGVHRGVRTLPK